MVNEKYEKQIQFVRIATGFICAFGGLGVLVCANLQFDLGVYFGVALVLISFAMLAILIVEQIISAWFSKWNGRVSILGLLLLTLVAGVFFAAYRNSIVLAIFILGVAATIASVSLETRR